MVKKHGKQLDINRFIYDNSNDKFSYNGLCFLEIIRQPEAKSEIMSTLFIGCAITESTGIYALLISLILILLKG